LSPRTGRPTTDPKNNDLKIRLSDSEVEKLKYCSTTTGMTRSDVIREGIDEVYQRIKNK